ncbi:cathepsin L-like proteinase [Aphelenchoides avenae]|nr:cathepsin L-like proteinase [Aphelenchus avenae]
MTRILPLLIGLCAFVQSTWADKPQFDAFIKKFNLTYTGAEYDYRFSVFEANLEKAAQLDQSTIGGEYGLTKFMDRTPEEFKKLLMPEEFWATPPGQNRSTWYVTPPERNNSGFRIPCLFDLRVLEYPVTWNGYTGWYAYAGNVRDQGLECAAGWAFTAAHLREIVEARAFNSPNVISPQVFIDCASAPSANTSSQGCVGGWVEDAKKLIRCEIMNQGPNWGCGAQAEAAYPYTGVHEECKVRGTDDQHPGGFVGGFQIGYLHNESDIPWHLVNAPGISVKIRVPESFQFYTGGVIDESTCANVNTNAAGIHNMLLVGYTEEYWILKNSFGTEWGHEGYVYIKRNNDVCGIGHEVIVAWMG